LSTEPVKRTFVRGNERLNRLLADPEIAVAVEEIEAESRELDRVYAENLAKIRQAGKLTQVDVAARMGVGQAVISRLEHRDDMLLSTLADYLHATGARNVRIVATLDDVEVELDLDQLRGHRRLTQNERHVVRNDDGGWEVRKPGSDRASAKLSTQADAISRASEIVANSGGGEVVVHNRNGRIRKAKAVPRDSKAEHKKLA
jgi:transcriptional regulator with XRE-family HTH domain